MSRSTTRRVLFLVTTTWLLPVATAFAEVRSIDSYGNNLNNLSWGAADTQLLRLAPPAYVDGIDDLIEFPLRANPRD